MRSAPYLDLSVRLREAIVLVRAAKAAPSAEEAAAFSKSAAVLLAAALERYVNDALDHACRAIKVSAWDELPAGVKSFLVAQMSRRLREAGEQIESPSDVNDSNAKRLRSVVQDAQNAFVDPSSWSHLPQFGVFMDGAAAPDRLNAVLRSFRGDGKSLLQRLEERGLDRGLFARALSDLVDSRHAAAHAIRGRPPPSPNDVSLWAVITFRLAREIAAYLREAVA